MPMKQRCGVLVYNKERIGSISDLTLTTTMADCTAASVLM